ncbi:Mov34/MPN/PAD-1 family protein [Methylophaga sp.]|uniref:Mov34/MPN/PAD-1 family protein n=1 Tax=Methylophaga sp. TaxID=2024840 RepID=UPI0025D19607|nr:Mov34/MPN/PAD-1 family protein [Methylophaga sp.]
MIDKYFILPNGAGLVHFTGEVIAHIYKYAQVKKLDKEAGGQLFSENPDCSVVTISVATGPYKEDFRSRTHFNPCLNIINSDREYYFSKGLFAVGLWHTHPELSPKPSHHDKITTLKYLSAHEGELNGFLQAIVGNTSSPNDLCVYLASNNKSDNWVRLKEDVRLDI